MADLASELARQALQGTRLRQLQGKQQRQTSTASDNVVSGVFVGYSANNTALVRLQNGTLVPVSQTSSGGGLQDERVCLVRNGGELISVWRSR